MIVGDAILAERAEAQFNVTLIGRITFHVHGQMVQDARGMQLPQQTRGRDDILRCDHQEVGSVGFPFLFEKMQQLAAGYWFLGIGTWEGSVDLDPTS